MSTQIIYVSGMTCGHCVQAVTEEVQKINGVTSVDVVLNTDGASQVTISADVDLSDSDIAAAIDEAGYEIASV